MKPARETKRDSRRRNAVPSVAIAGYTNAGKSSLLNRLTGAGVLVEDALFATLDPTVRRAQTTDGRAYTLTDTVGFVRRLPHQLVEAFRSTLEEVAEADLVLHVVDGSHPDPEGQLERRPRGADRRRRAPGPRDRGDQQDRRRRSRGGGAVAAARAGIDRRCRRAPGRDSRSWPRRWRPRLPRPDVEVDVVVPYERGDLVSRVHDEGQVLTTEHTPRGPACTPGCARTSPTRWPPPVLRADRGPASPGELGSSGARGRCAEPVAGRRGCGGRRQHPSRAAADGRGRGDGDGVRRAPAGAGRYRYRQVAGLPGAGHRAMRCSSGKPW